MSEDLCQQVMIQTTKSVLFGQMSKDGVTSFLQYAKDNVALLASIWSSQHKIQIDPSMLMAQIPATRKAVFHRLGLNPDLTTQACCRKCFALYPLDPTKNPKCTERFFSQAQMFERWAKSENIKPTCDQELWRLGSKKKIKPVRKFTYVTLNSWLKHRLMNPQFESALDSSLAAANRDPTEEMEDVWHGRIWQEFPNSDDGAGIFTQHSGNIVFSLYLDWFNSEGTSSLGKHHSLGAITLVCLNLPPTQRYKAQNMFVFGIIPGPKEPSLEQINHLLKPLVEELKTFWNPGQFFKTTANFPKGRTIRVAIFPLIADLPALRKAAGMSGHQSNIFCSFCLLERKDMEEIDVSKFPLRVHEKHLEHAKKWLETENFTERETLVKEHGARWSVLNELTYWQPIEHCAIELMHALILGNLKDHSLRFFSLTTVGAKLKEMQEKDAKWQNDQSYTNPPYNDKFGPKPKVFLKSTKGKRKRDPSPEQFIAEGPTKRTRQQVPGEASGSRARRVAPQPGSIIKSSSSSSTHPSSASDHSSTHSYQLRERKQKLYEMSEESDGGGYTSGRSDKTLRLKEKQKAPREGETPPNVPKLTPEELDVVRRTIMHTTVPSWIDRVPHNLGSASHGSLKAAEWLMLYKIYYTIALVPLWVDPAIASHTNQEKHRISALLESTTSLAKIAHFLTLPKIKASDLTELGELLFRYRTCLQKNWPDEPSRPNLHLTQHYPEVIKRFGPPRSTAAWAQERVNGCLQKIPTNHHPGQWQWFAQVVGNETNCSFFQFASDEIPMTLLKQWHVKSTFQLLVNNQTSTANQVEEQQPASSSKVEIELDPGLLTKWKRAIAGRVGSRGRLGDSKPDLSSTFELMKGFEINGKRFTSCNQHTGNSQIEFYVSKDQRFGEIDNIFLSRQTPGKTWLTVRPFKEVNKNEDPYREHPDLNCRLVQSGYEAFVVIDSKDVIGHAALLRHQSGTFGISTGTISAVGLGTSVSDS